jgi:hypothetical protein
LLASALAGAWAVVAAAPATASMVADRSACHGQTNIHAPEPKQEQALRCLIDHVRGGDSQSFGALERAAGRKAGDIFDCGFSHTACGRPFDGYAKRFGYASGTSSWKLGENLAWGKRKRGSARNALKAWLNSPPHRATLLGGSFEHIGIGLKRGRFSGTSKAAVWVLQIGCRGC